MTRALKLRQAGGLFDIARTILGWLFAGGENVDDLAELLKLWSDFRGVEDQWNTETGVKARLKILVKALRIIVVWTPTETDDALVPQLEALSNSDSFISFLAATISLFYQDNPDGTPDQLIDFVVNGPRNKQLREAAVTLALDWNTLVEGIKLVMQLISLFRGIASPADGGKGNDIWDF